MKWRRIDITDVYPCVLGVAFGSIDFFCPLQKGDCLYRF